MVEPRVHRSIHFTFIGTQADPVAAYPVKTRSPGEHLVIGSGGLDSAMLAHKVAAERTFTLLSVPHDTIEISAVGCLPTGADQLPRVRHRLTNET
ncbi:hypothetical protein DC522_12685 [Microvirga sp. KLBC 81]|uniref:Uncharacterized protein n=1 Tax=Microvirga vignae TaxID=1225564 RepID=A0A0H1RIS3_9HYPH|nr:MULTISPECIES: hypothetical protein [Microvirga]KLK92502.1 hypothetical protein AA309_14300 [Microvirga vignae]PVE23962.1 hypothetical protein DC522_12685 [Microvirga sp. KLBC 81]